MATKEYEEINLFAKENYNVMAPVMDLQKRAIPVMNVQKTAITDMTVEEMIHNIDIAIRLKSEKAFKKTCNEIVQALKYKEIKIIYDHYFDFDIVNRKIKYDGFHTDMRAVGKCYTHRTNLDAEITLSKNIYVENNGKDILDVLAHEVLHGILPYEEHHGRLFKKSMRLIEKELKVKIGTKGYDGKMKIGFKYEVYCPKCGRVFARYFRKCSGVDYCDSYICRRCQETLKSRKIR